MSVSAWPIHSCRDESSGKSAGHIGLRSHSLRAGSAAAPVAPPLAPLAAVVAGRGARCTAPAGRPRCETMRLSRAASSIGIHAQFAQPCVSRGGPRK
eukprot:scaffold97693_cov61-Phaeocystis_antarctica.AAC.7